MNIQPIADRVVIKPLPLAEKTSGGIIIPDMAKKNQSFGIVQAVGQSKMYEEDVPLTAGDEVIYESNAGIEHEEDGVKYRIVKKGSVIAKLN